MLVRGKRGAGKRTSTFDVALGALVGEKKWPDDA